MTRYDLRIEGDPGAGRPPSSSPGRRHPESLEALHADGAAAWPLAAVRELDDAILTLRANEGEPGHLAAEERGRPGRDDGASGFLVAHREDWLVNEIIQYWKRTVRRLDATSRSLFALIEPGSCCAGPLLEVALAADRQYMLDGTFRTPSPGRGPGSCVLDEFSLGLLPAPAGDPACRAVLRERGGPAGRREGRRTPGRGRRRSPRPGHPDPGRPRLGGRAAAGHRGAGQLLPRRADRDGSQPALRRGRDCRHQDLRTALGLAELDLQRPNAAGPQGALRRYGTGQRADYDRRRV